MEDVVVKKLNGYLIGSRLLVEETITSGIERHIKRSSFNPVEYFFVNGENVDSEAAIDLLIALSNSISTYRKHSESYIYCIDDTLCFKKSNSKIVIELHQQYLAARFLKDVIKRSRVFDIYSYINKSQSERIKSSYERWKEKISGKVLVDFFSVFSKSKLEFIKEKNVILKKGKNPVVSTCNLRSEYLNKLKFLQDSCESLLFSILVLSNDKEPYFLKEDMVKYHIETIITELRNEYISVKQVNKRMDILLDYWYKKGEGFYTVSREKNRADLKFIDKTKSIIDELIYQHNHYQSGKLLTHHKDDLRKSLHVYYQSGSTRKYQSFFHRDIHTTELLPDQPLSSNEVPDTIDYRVRKENISDANMYNYLNNMDQFLELHGFKIASASRDAERAYRKLYKGKYFQTYRHLLSKDKWNQFPRNEFGFRVYKMNQDPFEAIQKLSACNIVRMKQRLQPFSREEIYFHRYVLDQEYQGVHCTNANLTTLSQGDAHFITLLSRVALEDAGVRFNTENTPAFDIDLVANDDFVFSSCEPKHGKNTSFRIKSGSLGSNRVLLDVKDMPRETLVMLTDLTAFQNQKFFRESSLGFLSLKPAAEVTTTPIKGSEKKRTVHKAYDNLCDSMFCIQHLKEAIALEIIERLRVHRESKHTEVSNCLRLTALKEYTGEEKILDRSPIACLNELMRAFMSIQLLQPRQVKTSRKNYIPGKQKAI
ncbi:hypothetical protein M9194_02345 [Vibrio sp. S4M6]|uniref:hypothetical protein n=1 Tax=Vibrio sinus TaxID=2946865 RepID=UPI00202A0C92|nr:hypothetical protein [Vibrio sinus]MCL9780271.1 hypothetical protein [Vibrio sinus]